MKKRLIKESSDYFGGMANSDKGIHSLLCQLEEKAQKMLEPVTGLMEFAQENNQDQESFDNLSDSITDLVTCVRNAKKDYKLSRNNSYSTYKSGYDEYNYDVEPNALFNSLKNLIKEFEHIFRNELVAKYFNKSGSGSISQGVLNSISLDLYTVKENFSAAYREFSGQGNSLMEMKRKKKQKIKLSENQLKQIIEKSVKQVINEGDGHFFDNMKGAWEGAKAGYNMRKAANAGQDRLKYFNKEQARSGKSSTKVLQCFENISKIVEGLRMYWGERRWSGRTSTDHMFREISEIYQNLNVIKAIIRTPANAIDYFDDEIQYTPD